MSHEAINRNLQETQAATDPSFRPERRSRAAEKTASLPPIPPSPRQSLSSPSSP